jgi:hypothetical protein
MTGKQEVIPSNPSGNKLLAQVVKKGSCAAAASELRRGAVEHSDAVCHVPRPILASQLIQSALKGAPQGIESVGLVRTSSPSDPLGLH